MREREFRSLRAVVHWRPLAAVDWKARWPPPVSTRMRATVLRTSNSPLPLTTFLLRYFVENFPLIKLQLTSSFKYFLFDHAYIYKESVHWFNRYFFLFETVSQYDAHAEYRYANRRVVARKAPEIPRPSRARPTVRMDGRQQFLRCFASSAFHSLWGAFRIYSMHQW